MLQSPAVANGGSPLPDHATKPGIEEVRDRQEITELLFRYATAIDTKDYALLRTVFTEDALVRYRVPGGRDLRGPELIGWLESAMQVFMATQHVLTNPSIEIRGDRARSRTYLTATHLQRTRDDRTVVAVLHGVYTDRHRRTARGWRITDRTLDAVHVEGDFLDASRVRLFPRGSRRTEDSKGS